MYLAGKEKEAILIRFALQYVLYNVNEPGKDIPSSSKRTISKL